MRRLVTIATFLALAVPATASALPGAPSSEPGDVYDPLLQSAGGAAGGAMGSLIGCGAGVLFGVGALSLTADAGLSPVGLVAVASGLVVGTFGGAVIGGSWAVGSLGGPDADDEVWASMTRGAWLGAFTGVVVEVGLVAVLMGTQQAANPIQGTPLRVIDVALLSAPLIIGVTSGLGAAGGYQSVYRPPIDSLSFTPMLGHDRAGLSLGFAF